MCFAATVRTHGGVHFTIRLDCIFASDTAFLASLRLINKTFLSVELLLTGCEHKFVSTVLATESLVFVHSVYLTFWYIFYPAAELHRLISLRGVLPRKLLTYTGLCIVNCFEGYVQLVRDLFIRVAGKVQNRYVVLKLGQAIL